MHSWALEGSWARVAFSIVLSGKYPWVITVSRVIAHFFPSAFIFKAYFPSWYYTAQNSLSTSIRALGLSRCACYFKLSSRFHRIFIVSGLVNFLCLVYSSISGAWWCINARFTKLFPLPPCIERAMRRCLHAGLGTGVMFALSRTGLWKGLQCPPPSSSFDGLAS